ncbi:nitroreductase [Franzmannia qiaohouensis]|uniref:Nitroreductase n=1 Tax=Franzmannia qiaohouensis TaxID=1329370 RepID=A0ABU1HC12_9GAMM|nr:nitroreductase [Halomonas qiaohouensis]MDR5904170.1 nitroreductase [Halomonas qiaohouensis]
MHVDDAILSRRSVRRFLPTPVPRETLQHLLRVASQAPSGSNTQPWQVHVVSGTPLAALSRALQGAFDNEPEQHQAEYVYYPREWFEPYIGRRRRCGYGLYATLGIQREERDKRQAQARRNYAFFDAPVAMILTLDRRLDTGSFMDCGMFLQSLMLAARGQGLHSCAQAAIAPYHRVIREQLSLDDSELVLCALALGHADPAAPENSFVPERDAPEGFARFYGD